MPDDQEAKQETRPGKGEADRDQPEEFKRMEDLTKKLLRVPKRELNEKLKGKAGPSRQLR